MLDDRFLAELMDSAAAQDRGQLMEMMRRMTRADVAYFKGFVAGYTTAVRHLQAAGVEGVGNDAVQFPEIDGH